MGGRYEKKEWKEMCLFFAAVLYDSSAVGMYGMGCGEGYPFCEQSRYKRG